MSPSEVILSDLARGTDFPEGIAILVLSIVIVFGGSLVGLAKADDVVAYVVLAATSICFVLGLWLAMSADSRSVSAIEGELVDRMNVIQPVDASALSEEGSILEYVEPERAIYLPVLGSSVSLIGAVILFLSAMARPGTPGRPA